MPLRPRHGYAADCHRGLPADDLQPTQEFPAAAASEDAPHSSPHPPGSSWRET